MFAIILLTLALQLGAAEARAADECGASVSLRLDGFESYPHGSAQPSPRAQARLRRFTEVLAGHERCPVLVDGYAGDADLGLERARAVEASLIQGGVAASRIRAAGHGPGAELAGGRGVEISLLPPPEAARPKPRQAAPLRLSGYWREEAAYRVRAPDGLSKARSVFQLAATGRLAKNVSYTATGRAMYDSVFDLTRRYPAEAARDQRSELALRETYVDASLGNTDFRLGRQQIVWGEAVGVFAADVINAKDLREFILPDFDFLRIPQWAAEAERGWEDMHAELIWIPILEFNKTGAPGSEFAPDLPMPSRAPARVAAERKPPDSFKNGEAGARLSYIVSGWDLGAFYFHGWDRSPALYRTFDPVSGYVFSPSHERLPVAGATLSKELSGFVIRGEAVYSRGKALPVLDDAHPSGIVRKDTLDAVLGAGRAFFERLDVNVQFLERAIFAYGDRPIFQERPQSHGASLWLKTGFWSNRVEPELLLISALGRCDMLLRPKITATVAGAWQVRLGLDVFEGDPDGQFGRFAGRSRAYSELRFKF